MLSRPVPTRARSLVIAGASFVLAGSALGQAAAEPIEQKVAHEVDAIAELEREAVLATFRQGPDDGAPGKVLHAPPPKPERRTAPWPKAELQIPAALKETDLPSFYIYRGEPVVMAVDTARIGVKFTGLAPRGEDDALIAALNKLGVKFESIWAPGIANWRIIRLPQGLDNAGGVNALIEMLLTEPGFEFATPVFHHATIAGGYYMVTPEVNIRVIQDLAADADKHVAAAAPGFALIEGELGGLPGARQIRAERRNGFAVLKAANDLWFNPDIAWAEPDSISTMDLHFVPNDAFWGTGSMWGWEQNNDIDTDAETAWDLTRGNPAIRILVMDVGAEQDHPDINQNPGRDFTTGVAGGVFGGGPGTNCDRHGTPVAGIITGRINNTIGGVGVCPNCRTLSARTAVEDTNPCASTYASFSGSWLANALNWGLGQNCIISNSSFGVGSSNTITNAYDNAEASGMVHFASAGNGGADNIGDATLGYPSSLASVQAVAAIDSDGGRSSFSNFGAGLQFSAPGTNVRSPDRQGTLGYNGSAGAAGDYTTFGGTSAASPFAAGVCALVWSAFPDLSGASVLSLLRTSGIDLGADGYDTGFGWGFPRADFALRFPGPNNMWCDEATVIPSTAASYNPATYSTAGANAVIDELQESCEFNDVGVSHSVWYSFVPLCTGTIDINTEGSSYDTVISVFRGNCLSAVAIACDDDSGTGTLSQLTGVPVTANFTYLIKVSAYGPNGAGGTLDFNFVYSANPPTNDNCADATTILFNTYNTSRCTRGATSQLCENNETCEAGGVGTSRSVWWEFTPAVNGKIDADTNGSDYDTVLSIWNGCFAAIIFQGDVICLPSSQIACDDDGGDGLDSMLVGVPVRRGVTYRIKAAGYGVGNTGGDLEFHFAFRQCPADHNLDGVVSVPDIFAMLSDFFAGNSAADYDNSGMTGVPDIFSFLTLFFEGTCN